VGVGVGVSIKGISALDFRPSHRRLLAGIEIFERGKLNFI